MDDFFPSSITKIELNLSVVVHLKKKDVDNSKKMNGGNVDNLKNKPCFVDDLKKNTFLYNNLNM